mgnify:CR=1 FL=1
MSLYRVGLEKLYVQAKRWKNTVGRPLVPEFYGALAGQRATKGVCITTSSFTANAWEFANSVERIVLVDGAALTRYMMDFAVGVSHRGVRIPQVAVDYYEGERDGLRFGRGPRGAGHLTEAGGGRGARPRSRSLQRRGSDGMP